MHVNHIILFVSFLPPVSVLNSNENQSVLWTFFFFQFCNPHKWLSNGNWHVSEQRDKKRRKMRLSVRLRSRCTLKSQRQDNTSGLFWWTYLATQQKQYVWCENRALISKCSLCDAPFHYRNDIEIQMWRKIIRCYFLFSLRPLLYLQDATTEIPHIWYIPQR